MLSSNTQQRVESAQFLTTNDSREKGSLSKQLQAFENRAGKLYTLNLDPSKSPKTIEKEIRETMAINHPTIARFIAYNVKDLKDKPNLLLFVEPAKNGSLHNLLQQIQVNKRPANYDNTTKQMILLGIARGMKFLHDRKVIHFDLTDENVLLDEKLHPLIANFGQLTVDRSFNQSNNSLGEVIFKAPESIEGKVNNKKANVYSFGVIMYKVLTEQIPYKELNQISNDEFCKKVVNDDYRPQFVTPIKDSHKKLIERCWRKNPNERPTFKEIFDFLAYNDEYALDDINVAEVKQYIVEITGINDSFEELIQRSEKIEKLNTILKENDKQLAAKNGDLTTINNQLTIQINQLTNEIKQMSNAHAQSSNESSQYASQIAELNAKIEKLTAENNQYVTKIRQMNAMIFQLKNENSQNSGKIKQLTTNNGQLTSQIDQLKNEINQYLIQINQFKSLQMQSPPIQTRSINLIETPDDDDNITQVRKMVLKKIEYIKGPLNQRETSYDKRELRNNYVLDEFNTLKLKAQQSIVQQLLNESEYCRNNQFLINLNNLMLHLLSYNETEDYKCLEISRSNDSPLTDCKVRLHSNLTEFLYINEALNSPQLIDRLRGINNFTFEVKYAAETFNEIYNPLSDMQKFFGEYQMEIDIIVNNMQKTDKKLQVKRQNDCWKYILNFIVLLVLLLLFILGIIKLNQKYK